MILRSRLLACVSGLLLLAGCQTVVVGPVNYVRSNVLDGGFSSDTAGALIVGDEPYAVKAGAAILAEGGSAADAATAMYFALSVTYPVAAGLGGGGMCIVRDAARNQVEEFDFLARDAGNGGDYAVPGNVRGFAMLQSAYGVLPWQRDVSPGESYASAGFPISQALATRLAAAQDVIRLDANLSAEFLDESGIAKGPGTVVRNPELAMTLAAIRTQGPAGFYKGNVGARILAYQQAQGGAIDVPEFARYQGLRTTPQALQMGNQTVYLPRQGTGAGAFAGALFGTLDRAQQTSLGANDLQASVAVAVKQALTQFNVTSLPQDLGATGFAVTDRNGQSVSCAVTMNGPFGSGHNAEGTGVTLALSPSHGTAGLAAAFLTPVIAVEGGTMTLTGAGAGGPNGAAAMGYALARLARGDVILERSDLHSTGVAPYDTINAIVCDNGTCVALPDPGAHGLGASGDPQN
ncbi:MAG: gamma-glutamyltransferase [Proteobacteria bacterium]|nr:gamma-glutamyltransferase [Pseudomonadota bacterium]